MIRSDALSACMRVSTGLPFVRPYRTLGIVLALIGVLIVFFISLPIGIVLLIIGAVLMLIKRPAVAPVSTLPSRPLR